MFSWLVLKKNVLILFVGVTLSKICMKTKIESDFRGDFTIPGLFPLRCSSPDDIEMRTVAWIEAMKYTVEEENRRQNKSIFGYVIYDTYDSTNVDKTSFAILDTLLFPINNSRTSCACNEFVQQNTILGFIGPSESANCIYALGLTLPYKNFPIISYSATSVDLNDRVLYPNFFRTVPPDNYQALFIKDVLKNYNWTYIAVIAIDSSYGRAGIEQLVKVVENDPPDVRICFDFIHVLPQVYDPTKYSNVMSLLRDTDAKVIVVIGTFDLVQNLLTKTENKNLTNRTWLLSEATGKNSWFLHYNNTQENTFLFIVQTEGEDDQFKKYFFDLTYQNSSPWLKAAFEKYGVNESTNNFSTNNISQVFDLSMASFVQDAVKVLIEAFYLYQKTFATNLTQNIYNRTKFNELIKKVSFPILNNSKTFSFNSNQNPESAYFELYTLRNSRFVKIALWSNNVSLKYFTESTELHSIKSTCSSPCRSGEKKLLSPLNQCCWTCLPCPDNSITTSPNNLDCMVCDEINDFYPNENKTFCMKRKRIYWNLSNGSQLPHQVLILTFCSIAAMVNATFIFTFVKKKLTPIIRSSNYELSLIQLSFHFIIFILPLLTFPEETDIRCAIRIYLGSFLHVVIITIILAKVTLLVAVFSFVNHCKMSIKKTFYIRSKIVILLLLFPCFYIVLILVVHNSKYKIFIENDKGETVLTVQKYCNAHSFLVFHLGYVLVLSTLCGVQTFKGKNLPWKFNESSKVAYALLLSNITVCAMVGLNYSSLDTNTRRFTSCILMITSMFFLITILFLSKIKIVWKHPERNSRAEFQRNSFRTVYSNESFCSLSSYQNEHVFSKPINQDGHHNSTVPNQFESSLSIVLNQFTIEDLLDMKTSSLN